MKNSYPTGTKRFIAVFLGLAIFTFGPVMQDAYETKTNPFKSGMETVAPAPEEYILDKVSNAVSDSKPVKNYRNYRESNITSATLR